MEADKQQGRRADSRDPQAYEAYEARLVEREVRFENEQRRKMHFASLDPLKAELRAAERELSRLEALLDQSEMEVFDVEMWLDELQPQLQKATRARDALAAEWLNLRRQYLGLKADRPGFQENRQERITEILRRRAAIESQGMTASENRDRLALFIADEEIKLGKIVERMGIIESDIQITCINIDDLERKMVALRETLAASWTDQ